MKKFKVLMSLPPVWQIVEANDKEEAIEIAVDKDEWEGDSDYGGEDYEAKEIKEKKRK
jgi:hypothetical protein